MDITRIRSCINRIRGAASVPDSVKQKAIDAINSGARDPEEVVDNIQKISYLTQDQIAQETIGAKLQTA